MTKLLMLMFLIIAVLLYFLPGLIAGMRGHRNATAITILNIFLGWTFLGWVIALVWAFTNDTRRRTAYLPPYAPAQTYQPPMWQGSRHQLPGSVSHPDLEG